MLLVSRNCGEMTNWSLDFGRLRFNYPNVGKCTFSHIRFRGSLFDRRDTRPTTFYGLRCRLRSSDQLIFAGVFLYGHWKNIFSVHALFYLGEFILCFLC